MFRKIFVCLILFLFVGTSFGSFNSEYIGVKKEIVSINKSTISPITESWRMFRHDLARNGHSTSNAPSTNSTSWIYTAGNSIQSSPTVENGRVYFGSMDNKLYCVDAVAGEDIWQYDTGHPISSSPVVYDNKVYIGSTDSYGINGNNLYCLDALTGDFIWMFSTGSSQWGMFSSPAIADDKVYVGSGDHNVYCLNALNGSLIWNFTTNGEVCSSPAISDGKVYVGSYSGNVYCIDYETSDQIWMTPTTGFIISSPCIANGRVYIGSDKIYCLDAETGQNIWNRDPIFFYSSPAFFDNKIYICDIYQNVYCFDADNGIPFWQYETDGYESNEMWSSPGIADGKVYVGASDGAVYCLNAETGEKIWDYFTNYYPIFSSPAVAYGAVFIGDMDGQLICFGQVNLPPYKPNIYGPDNGTTNVNYTFCTGTVTDPEGDSLFCFWDWGDGTNSGWLGPYASGQQICASHAWSQQGVYCIKLKLKDNSGAESNWSDPFCINIVENQPPSAPIIKGPARVKIGVETSWSFVSTDQEGGNITYYVDWGDKCGGAEYYGPYPSGQQTNLSHKYSVRATLIINALAIDDKWAESNLTFFEVKISRDKTFTNSNIFNHQLEQFINFYRILILFFLH